VVLASKSATNPLKQRHLFMVKVPCSLDPGGRWRWCFSAGASQKLGAEIVGADLELEVAERAENGEDNRPGRLVVEVREHALAKLRPDPLEGDGRRDHA
jgi:hypothetical protein